jgi:hypothetical protein
MRAPTRVTRTFVATPGFLPSPLGVSVTSATGE